MIFLGFLVGFGVKMPIFPIHGWLPLVAEHGTIAVAGIFLLGLKTGIYALVRFVLPLLPDAVLRWHDWGVAFALVGIFYAATLALMQINLRRMLAFSSISHVGLVLLGIAAFNLQGIQGALYQLLNFTIVAGGIFLLAGYLHHRVGSTDIISLGGVARSMPLLAAFFFLFGLAGMGVPGTNGFPAEFLLILSALDTHTGAVDLGRRELLVVVVLAVLVLAAGLFPNAILELTRIASQDWVSHLTTH